jgi:hypothetical protein
MRDHRRMGTPDSPCAGTTFVQRGLLLPAELGMESDTYSHRWQIASPKAAEGLERRARAMGWSLFFLAGENRALVLGHADSRRGRFHRAIDRLLATTRTRDFNCMQVTEISERSLLGVPYTVLHAHACHLQKGYVLESAETRADKQVKKDWAQD